MISAAAEYTSLYLMNDKLLASDWKYLTKIVTENNIGFNLDLNFRKIYESYLYEKTNTNKKMNAYLSCSMPHAAS